jgi:uncharacterized membrane protein
MATEKMSGAAKEGQACAALSYILVGIIWFFADENMKKNSFVKFHAKQGLVLLIAWIAYSIVLSILWMVLWFIGPLLWLLYLVPWVLVAIGIINAVNGRENELPVIGKFASVFKF